MALLRPSQLSKLPRDAIVLDLGDLASQGKQICEAAQARAEQIIANARVERERILAGAHDAGFARGLEEGRAAGMQRGQREGESTALAERRERLTKLDETWAAALAKFEADREGLLQSARTDLLSLALLIAERVIKRRIESDASVVVDQVAAAATQVASASGVVVSVHPDDLAIAQAALPELSTRISNLRHATLVGDAGLTRGSCVMRSAGGGVVDASIETQLERITQALVPARTAPEDGA